MTRLLLTVALLVGLSSSVHANDYYTHGSFPSAGSSATSAGMRAELDLITAGFNKFPSLSGNAARVLVVNGSSSAVTLTAGTLALAGNFAITGAFATTLTVTNTTNVTLPTAGTLATLTGIETLSNKTLVAAIFSGTFTGTYTLAGAGTITAPTITTPVLTTPAISNPAFSGTATGSLTSLALTNALLTTSTVAADPSAALGVASKQYVDAHWTTGDVKMTLKTTADSGWVLMNDGTIGNGSSGGTTRANADTSTLFTLLWTNCANADCAVSTGRGGSAAADFAANKTIALPKALGRALAVAGSGSGLSSRALGAVLGAEDAVVVSHSHTATVTDPGHTHTSFTLVGGGTLSNGPNVAGGTTNTGSSTTGITVGNSTTGVSGTGANMQPSTFINIMIKL